MEFLELVSYIGAVLASESHNLAFDVMIQFTLEGRTAVTPTFFPYEFQYA
jgi:hypothetical protein